MPRAMKEKEDPIFAEPTTETVIEDAPEDDVPEKKKKVKRVRSEAQIEAQKNNKWLVHLREYRESHPELSYKAAMKAASPSWADKKNTVADK
jgi:hypothetical protein